LRNRKPSSLHYQKSGRAPFPQNSSIARCDVFPSLARLISVNTMLSRDYLGSHWTIYSPSGLPLVCILLAGLIANSLSPSYITPMISPTILLKIPFGSNFARTAANLLRCSGSKFFTDCSNTLRVFLVQCGRQGNSFINVVDKL